MGQKSDTLSAQDERTPLIAETDTVIAQTIDVDVSKSLACGANSFSPIPDGDTRVTADDDQQDDDKPLPVQQILLLCFARVVEPLVFFSIFPYVNQMVERTGNLSPSDVGFYTGLIESLFSLTQMIVMIGWGRLSDRYGRKPVLVTSLIGCGVGAALFGFSQHIWQMILFRCLGGFFAGSLVTIQTMIRENSTKRTQARAFSWFAFAGNLGILFGPLIGGALSDPAVQYGGWFEHVRFFRTFPYALATLTTGLVALVAGVTIWLFATETLAAEDKSKKTNQEHKDDQGTWSLLRAPGVGIVLYLYAHIMLLAFGYTAVVPVFYYEPVELGGLGFSPAYISLAMALIGLSQAIWLLVIFPPIQNRIGTGGVLRWCANVYWALFVFPPLLNLLRRSHDHTANVLFWIVGPITSSLGVGVSMCYTAIQLALNDVSPSPNRLGELNATALTLISGLRAFTPATFTALYAVTLGQQWLKGYAIWLVLIVIAWGYTIAVRWLPEKAEGRIKNPKTANTP